MAIQAPRGFAVIEDSPGAADNDLVWVLSSHCLIEVCQIFFAPVTTVRCPALIAWIDPRIEPVECIRILSGKIFLYEQRRRLPFAHDGADLAPIGMPSLGKDEDDRLTVIGQIGLASRGVRSQISLMEHSE